MTESAKLVGVSGKVMLHILAPSRCSDMMKPVAWNQASEWSSWGFHSKTALRNLEIATCYLEIASCRGRGDTLWPPLTVSWREIPTGGSPGETTRWHSHARCDGTLAQRWGESHWITSSDTWGAAVYFPAHLRRSLRVSNFCLPARVNTDVPGLVIHIHPSGTRAGL